MNIIVLFLRVNTADGARRPRTIYLDKDMRFCYKLQYHHTNETLLLLTTVLGVYRSE